MYIQQAGMVINAGAGGDSIDLCVGKDVAAHTATVRGNYGNGATITLDEGQDYLIVNTLNSGTLTNFHGSNSAAANRSMAAHHITVADCKANEDQLIFGSSNQEPRGSPWWRMPPLSAPPVCTTRCSRWRIPLPTRACRSLSLSVRHLHPAQCGRCGRCGDTSQIDTADSLNQLVGIQDLQDIAGKRGIGS